MPAQGYFLRTAPAALQSDPKFGATIDGTRVRPPDIEGALGPVGDPGLLRYSGLLENLVPQAGFEPARPCGQNILGEIRYLTDSKVCR